MRRLAGLCFIQHPVHLIELPLRIPVLHRQLIAVGLADGAGTVGPAVPDVAPEIVDVVGLLLPDPQQLVDAGLEIGAAQGENGELLPQVVAVDDAEFFHRVGGCAVIPVGAHLQLRVPYAVGQDLPAVLDKAFVCVAHWACPPVAAVVFFILPQAANVEKKNFGQSRKEASVVMSGSGSWQKGFLFVLRRNLWHNRGTCVDFQNRRNLL